MSSNGSSSLRHSIFFLFCIGVAKSVKSSELLNTKDAFFGQLLSNSASTNAAHVASKISHETIITWDKINELMPPLDEEVPKDLIPKLEALVNKIPAEELRALIQWSLVQFTNMIAQTKDRIRLLNIAQRMNLVYQKRVKAVQMLSPEGQKIAYLAGFLNDYSLKNQALEVIRKLNPKDAEIFEKYGVPL